MKDNKFVSFIKKYFVSILMIFFSITFFVIGLKPLAMFFIVLGWEASMESKFGNFNNDKSTIFRVLIVSLTAASAVGIAKIAKVFGASDFMIVLAALLTLSMLAIFIEHTWRWLEDGGSVIELIIFLILAVLMFMSMFAIANVWSIIATSDFWKSVIVVLPYLTFIGSVGIILFDFFFFRYKLKRKVIFMILAIAMAVIFSLLALKFLTEAIKWGSLISKNKVVTETTETITTVAETESEEEISDEVEEEVEVVEEQQLEYKTMANGVVYNYDEYLDRDNKEAYNAFGYDKSEFHGDEDAMKHEFIKIADLAPEYLAAYAEGFFFDEEKKELGINGKTAVEIDDYMSVEQNVDAGKLQEDLITALAAKVFSDEVEFRFVKENGWEYTYYIYETGQTPEGLTPFGARLSVDHKKRKDAPQVEVYRKVYDDKGGGKDGKFHWVKVLDLNEECGLQVNVPKVPKGTPVVPSDKPPVNPPPTPTPPTPPKYNKDKTQGTKGEVVQQNDTPKAGEPTNNPANPKSSTKEEPGNTGNGKTTYKEYQEEIKELKEDNSENPKAPKEIETPTPVSDLAEKADGNKIPNNEKNPETKHITVPD